MYQLYMKLRSVKAVFKEQNLVCFGNLKQRVMQACDNLNLAQQDVIASLGRAELMFLLLRMRNLS